MLRLFKLATVVLLLMVLTISGFAQKFRLGFFLNAAGYFPIQENISNGFGSGLGAVFYLNRNISVSFEWKYGRFSVDKTEGEFLKGTLYLTPLLVSIRYDFQTGTSFSPYVFLGGGIFFSNIGLDEERSQEDANVRKQDIKNGSGFYGGIGSRYKINESLSLFIEGLYMTRKTDVETIHIDNSPADRFKANLSSFSFLVGFNYFY